MLAPVSFLFGEGDNTVDFIQLHNHSSHSLLDGLGNPDKWVDAAIAKGMSAVALTDHGSCSAALAFYKAAREKGIIPIVGTEFYVADDPAARATKKSDRIPRFHLTVLAKKWDGLKSIFKQLSLANSQLYYKPLLSIAQCHDFKDCVIMTGCAVGILSHPYFEKIIPELKATYGEDFYIEIMPHQLEIQRIVNERAVKMCKAHDISPVATNDCHYPTEEDTLTHDILLAIQTNRRPDDTKYFSFLDGDEPLAGLYLKDDVEMLHSFKSWVHEGVFDLPFLVKAFTATCEIARKCSGLIIPKMEFTLPSIPALRVSTPTDECRFLLERINEGFKKLSLTAADIPNYQARVKHEMGVISKIGAIRYFLIVWDIIRYAKTIDVLCGFGRGSAGGSLVAYLLGIVGLDPLKHDLYFERFLREDRIDMPDIDLDFAGKDRERVIQYVRDSYGAENVSQISTSGYMHGKTAFRDVARVFGIDFKTVNELSKRIDNDIPILDNFRDDAALAGFKLANPQLVKYAARLDGQLRSKGVHAGGVIITEGGFDERGVLERRAKTISVNWNMDEVEHFGLLKVDALGLNNLSVLGDTAKMVFQRTGETINYFEVEPDDPEVLAQFSCGYTEGFFQFESDGITGLCKRLAPIKSFKTLVHINALYRPGPLDSGMVESYARRYRKEESVMYNHPSEASITAETLGLPIFQEQIMAFFVKLAGFTWPEADNMRKIIAKSKGVLMLEENRPAFVKGCHEISGIKDSVANVIYDAIVKFGKYGFNKSHAADYSLISYLTAWAKHHYPIEFMASLLRSVIDESEQTARYMKEVRRIGSSVLPPDINNSEDIFSIVGDAIIVGFSSVKGVGPAAAEKIQEARNEKGRFTTFFDFLEKTERRVVNKRVVTALAKAGAFASICHNTKWIIDWYESLNKGGSKAAAVPHPGEYEDFDSREKDSMRIEIIPGVFSGDDIEVTARMEIDKPVLEMLNGQMTGCDRCEACSSGGPIPFKFGKSNRILLVSQKTDASDEIAGEPFSGRVADSAWKIIREELDLTPGKFLRANAFMCRPPGDKLAKEVIEKSPCAKIWLDKLIRATKPELILSLGGAGFTFFTGKPYGIMKANATTLWHPGYQALVLFAIHPGQLYFDTTGEKEELFRKAIRVIKDYL
ncbi:MAG: DNA polymerase III subunit alpha [Desulfobacterales bacterium]|nr:DNA polymerase III subunit alpha [Desulfobacterales bacterium]